MEFSPWFKFLFKTCFPVISYTSTVAFSMLEETTTWFEAGLGYTENADTSLLFTPNVGDPRNAISAKPVPSGSP